MSGKQRRTKRRNASKHQKSSNSRKPQEEPATPVSWHGYAAVIVVALILLAAFIITQFDPIDRLTMLGASTVCVGIAFLIVGTSSAVGNYDFNQDSWLGKVLGYLTVMATSRKRTGSLPYSRGALYAFFDWLLIVVVLPLGFILAFLRPKRTWPAILWIGGGLAAILGTYVAAVTYNSLTY